VLGESGEGLDDLDHPLLMSYRSGGLRDYFWMQCFTQGNRWGLGCLKISRA